MFPAPFVGEAPATLAPDFHFALFRYFRHFRVAQIPNLS
jgi:hypothetical protein